MTTTTPATKRLLREHVAEEIRAALARRRISAARLARELGVSQTYVWRRLAGETAFDLDDLERIAGVLAIDVIDLLPPRKPDIAPYPGQPERRSTAAARPVDNRPSGRPEQRATPAVRRTAMVPRSPHRTAA